MGGVMENSNAAEGSSFNTRKQIVSPMRLLILLVLVAIASVGIAVAFWPSEAAVRKEADERTLRAFGLTRSVENRLAATFADADGDLVADPPSDPAALRDPEVIVFSYVAKQGDGEEHRAPWEKLVADLAARAGKTVDHVVFETTDEQLRALRDGRLHVTGFNTGSVPRAVNACGFVPVCTLGRADGSFGITTKIIVPQDSPMQTVRDLRGRKLTFTEISSNSGFKAPAVLLWKDFGLAPDRDYAWGFSYGHEESIRGVASGELAAAAVASDMLARALGDPDESRRVPAEKVRVIYSSERFPPAAIGYAHDLVPELAEAIRKTLLEFAWAGTGLETAFGSDATQFVPVSYKDDFAVIRRIDDTLGSPHEVK